MIYENESGIFICDKEGRLLKYECSPENRLALSDCSQRFRVFGQDWENENRKDKSIRKLVIPSGVRQIGSCTSGYREKGDISFEDYVVRDEIVFPESLKIIGAAVFESAMLPEVRFSSALNVIGAASFFDCRICRLILSSDIKPTYGFYYSNQQKAYFTDVPGQGAVEITESELLERYLCFGGRQFKYACIDMLAVPDGYESKQLLFESDIRKVIKYKEYDARSLE